MLKLKMRTQRPKLGCVGALNYKVNFQTLIVVMIFHSQSEISLALISLWTSSRLGWMISLRSKKKSSNLFKSFFSCLEKSANSSQH